MIKVIQEIVGTDAEVVFDVGAKGGDFATQYLAVFPKATVYAFEPAPASFQLVAAVGNPRLRAVQSAVMDYDGTVDLYLNSHVGSHSTLEIDRHPFPVAGTVTVPAITLDTFCALEDIDRIDFLKVDTNGADLLVLEGAGQLFAQDRIGVVSVELIYYPYYTGQPVPEDITEFLRHFGMQMVALSPHYYQGSRRYADAVFSGCRKLL